jgi:hypothetical protein
VVKRTWLLAVLCVAMATGLAAKMKVKVQHDKSFDFSAVKTYAWHPDGAGEVKLLQAGDDAAAIKARLEPSIKAAVERELAKKGLVPAASGAADLHVYYYLLAGPKASMQTAGQFVQPVPGWGLPPFGGATTSLDLQEHGSLIVDLSSPRLKSAVWRGTAQTEIHREKGDGPKRISEGVAGMFKEFPPKK